MVVLLRINSTPAGDPVAWIGGVWFPGTVAAPVWLVFPVSYCFWLGDLPANTPIMYIAS